VTPLYVIELDFGGGVVVWEFYEGSTGPAGPLEGIIERAPLWESVLE
jgi:hypothetical protein